ncbi:hypothetical protein RIR_jg33169.t1 [Rhizophagus irregularis DAOM 181602=DAOM 197198]|nr:hypothetical protein RhiirB3_454366 [Rhizophagus irregularis]GBC17315.2 hypothetical protein RIR_jg33169.t1 [Rhizophagus irregularis DAOM 181602=DAOM 197198]
MVSLRRSTDSGGGTGYISPSSFRETNTPAWRECKKLCKSCENSSFIATVIVGSGHSHNYGLFEKVY